MLTDDDRQRLEEIAAREREAYPGPWEHDPRWPENSIYREMTDKVGKPDSILIGDNIQDANVPFIAHARTDIPYLLELVRVLEAEVARLKRGDFTTEEFQSLCHHLDEKPGCTRADFEQGCREYQAKLFGVPLGNHGTEEQRRQLVGHFADALGIKIAFVGKSYTRPVFPISDDYE